MGSPYFSTPAPAPADRDGFHIQMTGRQAKIVRVMLGESQKVFGRRFAVSQAAINRLEASAERVHCGPIIILIKQVADQNGITIPDQPIRPQEAAE